MVEPLPLVPVTCIVGGSFLCGLSNNSNILSILLHGGYLGGNAA